MGVPGGAPGGGSARGDGGSLQCFADSMRRVRCGVMMAGADACEGVGACLAACCAAAAAATVAAWCPAAAAWSPDAAIGAATVERELAALEVLSPLGFLLRLRCNGCEFRQIQVSEK